MIRGLWSDDAIEESASSPFSSIVIVSRPRVVEHHMGTGFCSAEETTKGGKVIYYSVLLYLRKSGLLHRSVYCRSREKERERKSGAGSKKGDVHSQTRRRASFVFVRPDKFPNLFTVICEINRGRVPSQDLTIVR